MSKIDDLLFAYKKQVALPERSHFSTQEKIWFCIYDPSQERRLRKQLGALAMALKNLAISGCRLMSLEFTINGLPPMNIEKSI